MPTKPPTKAERNQNLDALKSAVDTWAKDEQDRLENEVKFMRAVLNGRSAAATGTQNLDAVSQLLQSEIDQFILSSD